MSYLLRVPMHLFNLDYSSYHIGTSPASLAGIGARRPRAYYATELIASMR